MKHKASESKVVVSLKRFGQAFIVACKASKARCPPEAALHHPAARQQHKSSLGLGVFDHLQGDAVCLRSLLSFFSRVSLIRGELKLNRNQRSKST
jgi:hypothetical protein